MSLSRILKSKDGTNNIVNNNDIVNNIFYNNSTCIDIDDEPTDILISDNLFFNTSNQVNFRLNNKTYSFINFQQLVDTKNHIIESNF
jgi:hypothetical protein